jgi:acyl-CoA synthetase (AMP-forming)/AMP-acid ligase II/1-acyl-sn-glycerol-3-phosphate acyltransferase/acyl carrier protein
MASTIAPVVARALAILFRPFLSLRYRLVVSGLDEVAKRGQAGILFLPNHAALVDPVILTLLLYPKFKPRALADEYQINRSPLGRIAHLFGARILPSLERQGAEAKDQMRAALAATIDGLKAGESLLMYPAGRLKRQTLEEIGGASGVETIVKNVPGIRVVLVRHNGLWGSSFSLGRTGRMPSLGGTLVDAIKALLINGIFFMPKRTVTIEFVEPADFPRDASRREINRYLEAFYNVNPAPNTYVPYRFWEGRAARALADPVSRSADADATSIPEATRRLVIEHIKAQVGASEVRPEQHLARDLGFDSLASAELVTWVEREFGFSVGTPESLNTVADVVLAAAGKGVSALLSDLKPVPPIWFAGAGDKTRVTLPAAATITEAFLARAAKSPGHAVLADQTGGVRSFRNVVTALLILKPLFERLDGEYLGIMLPPSGGAAVLYLAALFAGKTPVMVNWTTGARNVRHSLDLLGVRHIVTASALLTRLETMGVDLGELRDRFVPVETLVPKVGKAAKLGALARSYLTWKELERVRPREHAVVLFTSGSENLPKAVPLTHENLLTNVRDVLDISQMHADDVLLGFLPPFHSFGLTITLVLPCITGIRVVFHTNPTEAGVISRIMEAYRTSVLVSTPTFLAGIVRVADDRQLASLRLAVTGAEKCPDQLFAALHARCPKAIVLEGYGITECSPVVSANDMDAPVPGSIGRLLPSVEGAIVDLETAGRIAPGETGMLLVRGPSIFGGYLHYSGESPFVTFEGRPWYRTGDLVSLNADGVLFFKGRLKRFIKLGGEMISLPAIEAELVRHFREADDGPVIAVEALGTPENPDIVLFAREAVDRALVNTWLREAGLSALHNVRQVVQVDEIPVLGTGKTDYRTLKARHEAAR